MKVEQHHSKITFEPWTVTIVHLQGQICLTVYPYVHIPMYLCGSEVLRFFTSAVRKSIDDGGASSDAMRAASNQFLKRQ